MNILNQFIVALAALVASVAALLNAASKFKKQDAKPETTQKNSNSGSIFKSWIFWAGVASITSSFVFICLMLFLPAHPATSRDVALAALYLTNISTGLFNINMASKLVRPTVTLNLKT